MTNLYELMTLCINTIQTSNKTQLLELQQENQNLKDKLNTYESNNVVINHSNVIADE